MSEEDSIYGVWACRWKVRRMHVNESSSGEEPRVMSGRGHGWRARRRGTPIAASYGHVPGVVGRRYLRNRHTLPRYGKGSLYLHRNTRTVAGGGAGRVAVGERRRSRRLLAAHWRCGRPPPAAPPARRAIDLRQPLRPAAQSSSVIAYRCVLRGLRNRSATQDVDT